MKMLAQFLLATVIGPGVALLLTYGVAAFIAWDWAWASTADPAARFFFCIFAIFSTIFGFAGGCTAAAILD